MRTIGRRIAPGHRQDFHAHCDICGVLWYRSQLRLDGAGRLVCPDEGPGLDEVTLAEMDADILARAAQRRGSREKLSGRIEEHQGDFYSSPVSIASPSKTVAWWAPENGLTSAGRFQWRNAAPHAAAGDLAAASGESIVVASNGVTFDGSAPMRAPSGRLAITGDDLAVWVVGSVAAADAALGQKFVDLGAVTESSAAFLVSIGRPASLLGETIFVQVKRSQSDAGLIANSTDTVDTSIHIFKISLSGTALALTVDDASYTATKSGTFGGAFTNVVMGLNLSGTVNEVAVTEGAGDVDDEMKAYFRRRWPSLPPAAAPTTSAASTLAGWF